MKLEMEVRLVDFPSFLKANQELENCKAVESEIGFVYTKLANQ